MADLMKVIRLAEVSFSQEKEDSDLTVIHKHVSDLNKSRLDIQRRKKFYLRSCARTEVPLKIKAIIVFALFLVFLIGWPGNLLLYGAQLSFKGAVGNQVLFNKRLGRLCIRFLSKCLAMRCARVTFLQSSSMSKQETL
jgi:hypothetical protein